MLSHHTKTPVGDVVGGNSTELYTRPATFSRFGCNSDIGSYSYENSRCSWCAGSMFHRLGRLQY